MAEWTNRDDRQAAARAEYERIMTTPSPDPSGAYLESGVIGYVFGEMWRRGVLTPRDRRFITLTCVAAAGAITPIETHVWAALNSDEVTYAELDELILHLGTQIGWPKASVMQMYGMISAFKLVEERGGELEPHDFERWADPVDDDVRRARGVEAYEHVHGVAPAPADTPFRGRAELDYLYGEIWTRERHLSRRDRRIVTICGAAYLGDDEITGEHLRAALALGDLSIDELRELVMHYTVYVGWILGRRLDDLLSRVAADREIADRDLADRDLADRATEC